MTASTGVTAYSRELGAALRAVRNQQGWSLANVEDLSGGKHKAVVVGSYERGDRSPSPEKLAALCRWYGVHISEVIPGGVPQPRTTVAAILRGFAAHVAAMDDAEIEALGAQAMAGGAR